LQRNKVKLIVDFVDLIQSVDTLRLAEEIDQKAEAAGKIQDVLVQVNVALEESKFGLAEADVTTFLRQVADLENLRVKGLMNIAPFLADPREVYPLFVEMKSLFDDIKKESIPGIEMQYLSMGMTHDFEVAIEAGSNMVRIGTGIFAGTS
jgi:pyridoxal phosphate enzyme (YggS family)